MQGYSFFNADHGILDKMQGCSFAQHKMQGYSFVLCDVGKMEDEIVLGKGNECDRNGVGETAVGLNCT
jgi:hypothetical protein